MISFIVVAIYLSFIYDFLLAPIPSEASTHNLVTRPERVKPRQRMILALAHAGLLALWAYPLAIAVMAVVSDNHQSSVSSWLGPWMGILVAAAGRGITIVASMELRHRGTASLVNSGVFGFSRHPIVLGLHMTLFGLLLSSSCIACLLVFPLTLIYFDQKVRIEESALLQRFGKSYQDYARVTPRYLLYIGELPGKPHGN